MNLGGPTFLNLSMLNERLTGLISRFASSAMEARQVARRLHGLLPSRFLDLKREHGRTSRSAGAAERLALADERYVGFIDELATMTGEAAAARVQYETHSMLFQARQSLRFTRGQKRR